MKRRIAIALLSVALIGTTISLSGCGGEENELMKYSKEDLVLMVENQKGELENSNNRILELEGMLKGLQIEDTKTPAISTFGDGTGRLTFNSINDKIVFPVPFQYPNATQAPNSAFIGISGSVSVKPANNWLMKLDGTTLNLNHTSGIEGRITVSNITEGIVITELQTEVFTPFFKDFPPETINYSKTFLDADWCGMQADTGTTINKEPAIIKCGMLANGSTQITYMFLYNGERDSAKDEMITSLLNTMSVDGRVFRVE